MTDVCRHCRLPESEHHEFEASAPCGCDPKALTYKTCQNYALVVGLNRCARCGHDRECHGGTK